MFGNEKTVIRVEGMMCEHCAAHVKTALEKLPDVKGASVDLKAKEVTVKTKGPFDEETAKKAIEEAGYRYAGLAA